MEVTGKWVLEVFKECNKDARFDISRRSKWIGTGEWLLFIVYVEKCYISRGNFQKFRRNDLLFNRKVFSL